MVMLEGFITNTILVELWLDLIFILLFIIWFSNKENSNLLNKNKKYLFIIEKDKNWQVSFFYKSFNSS